MTIRLALVALALVAAPALARPAVAQEQAEPEAALEELAEPEAEVEAEEQVEPEAAAPEQEPPPASPPPVAPPSDTPSPFTVRGFLRLQAGVFVPLASDSFRYRQNKAFVFSGSGSRRVQTNQACDPVVTPNIPCYPLDHGQEPGSLSMARAALQIDVTWTPSEAIAFRSVVRGVRSLELDADEWAQIPVLAQDPSQRRELAKEWVHDTYYNEIDFRQLYVDLKPSDALSFRVGRQLWRETGQYRLLDVVNPYNDTWHFGPLESFEDTRVPLWMASGLIQIDAIDHSVELIWAPLMLDRPRDTVTAPLSLVGAWGIPYSNTPSPYVIGRKVFDYPGRSAEDMRGGVHWKGNLGERSKYSLLYFYTHQIGLPIPTYFDERLLDPVNGLYDSGYLERLILEFPRQHVAGLSFDYAFEGPINVPTMPFGVPSGLVAKFEAIVEANRTYPVRTDSDSISGGRRPDPTIPGRWHFQPKEKLVPTYGLQLQRPTMIPFLNAQMPFLLMGQFSHTIVPVDEQKDALLTEIPGYNDYEILPHQMRFVAAIATVYLQGFLVPKLIGAFVYPDSGFYSLDLGINFSRKFGFHITATDFIGSDPYKRLGLFRDRDELNFSMTAQF